MNIQVMWSTSELVSAIADLPVEGPFPCRTVLVPRERVAHSLRRELLRTGHGDVLVGTRFVTPAALSREVLMATGVDFREGEERFRSARLKGLFKGDLDLRYFDIERLRNNPGWPEAVAASIADFESAGFRPEDLASDPDDRLADLATIWKKLDESAADSFTSSRILVEAAAHLEESEGTSVFCGTLIAAVLSDQTIACARFMRAMPDVHLAVLAARPVRKTWLDRMEIVWGAEFSKAVQEARAPRSSGSERDLLASYLFEPVSVLADNDRPRSIGPDDTVHLEEHAGVESEVEATVDWVARQVLENEIPLEDVAVLVPALDPFAGMIAERLARLPFESESLSVHVAGGLPVTGTSAGARVLTIIKALKSHLSLHEIAEALPSLRLRGEELERTHLSRAQAMECIGSLGAVGGYPGNPRGALDWSTRINERLKVLAQEIKDSKDLPEDEDTRSRGRTRVAKRLHSQLTGIQPALESLVKVASSLIDGAVLPEVVDAFCGFLNEFLLQPGSGSPVSKKLERALKEVCSNAVCSSLTGEDALNWIQSVLLDLRNTQGRYGEPAVYVGEVQGAVGLRFSAVRILGLAEGTIPPIPHEDPVVPDELRTRFGAGRLGVQSDRTLSTQHALDCIVRETSQNIVLSFPRSDVGGVQREPSSVILEAAAALGRPDPENPELMAVVPSMSGVRRLAFEPARERVLKFRLDVPLTESAWLERASSATYLGEVPGTWTGRTSTDLERVSDLQSCEAAGSLDGVFSQDGPFPTLPGLDPDLAISVSRMRALLECPHKFLFQNVLGWDEPPAVEALREIDNLNYGSLFHESAASFYRDHGKLFCQRKHNLRHWQGEVQRYADGSFDALMRWYPLVGIVVIEQQRQRLKWDLKRFLRYDWEEGAPRTYHGVEIPFGYPEPVPLKGADNSILYAHGFIDRIDVEDDRTLVRDLKTGRVHPRKGDESSPTPAMDVQIAVYGMVAGQMAGAWGIPSDVGVAYSHLFGRSGAERSFRDDFNSLDKKARNWIALVHGLLKERCFPRTTDSSDCRYCPFKPVCGRDATKRSSRLFDQAEGVAGDFLRVRSV